MIRYLCKARHRLVKRNYSICSLCLKLKSRWQSQFPSCRVHPTNFSRILSIKDYNLGIFIKYFGRELCFLACSFSFFTFFFHCDNKELYFRTKEDFLVFALLSNKYTDQQHYTSICLCNSKLNSSILHTLSALSIIKCIT